MDLLIVFFKIWLVLVVAMFIYVELEKDNKNTKKNISADQVDVSHQINVSNPIPKVPNLTNETTSINSIVEDLISTNWAGYEKLEVLIDLVKRKYEFSPRQFDLIFTNSAGLNTADQSPLAVVFARAGHIFSIDMLLKYKNPACEHGWTVAHEMAKQNYRFSKEDLELLGNPADNRNLTVEDIMVLQNNASSVEEKHAGNKNGQLRYLACASYNIHEIYEKEPEQPEQCIHCGSKLEQTKIDASAYAEFVLSIDPIPAHWYSYLFTCNSCQWWCVRECFSLCELMRDEDILLIGVANNNHNGLQDEQKPWEKFLQEKSVYFHDLIMTDELRRLFSKKEQVNQTD